MDELYKQRGAVYDAWETHDAIMNKYSEDVQLVQHNNQSDDNSSSDDTADLSEAELVSENDSGIGEAD